MKCNLLHLLALLILLPEAGHAQQALSSIWPPPGAQASSTPAKAAIDKTALADLEMLVQEAKTRYHIPSMVVGLLDGGKVVLEKPYGTDPLYTFAKNGRSNVYILGSVSQVYTGYALLLLVQQGRVKLTSPVSQYLPSMPAAWRSITVEQLLAHATGIPEFPKEAGSFTAAVEAVSSTPLRFAPGRARYLNYSDYDILGQVIEKVSGRPYLKFMQDAVFSRMKLSMTGDAATLLAFRLVAPEDVRTTGVANLTRDSFGVAAGTNSGRRTDSDAKWETLRLMTRGIPEYAIPSKGLVADASDLLKFASAIASGGLPGITLPDYLKTAPGWNVCRSGDEILLKAHGMTGSGFAAVVDVIPGRKSALVILYKLEPGSEVTDLHQENDDILDQVLAFPVSDMKCNLDPTETEEPGNP